MKCNIPTPDARYKKQALDGIHTHSEHLFCVFTNFVLSMYFVFLPIELYFQLYRIMMCMYIDILRLTLPILKM